MGGSKEIDPYEILRSTKINERITGVDPNVAERLARLPDYPPRVDASNPADPAQSHWLKDRAARSEYGSVVGYWRDDDEPIKADIPKVRTDYPPEWETVDEEFGIRRRGPWKNHPFATYRTEVQMSIQYAAEMDEGVPRDVMLEEIRVRIAQELRRLADRVDPYTITPGDLGLKGA